jgi:putative polyhydroxyalkanoate system protein
VPEIRIQHGHSLTVDDVKTRLHGFSEMLGKYGIRLEWHGHEAKFAGVPGVGGAVAVAPDKVHVHVTLSRMLTMMGLDPVKLEGTIRRRLAEALDGG